MPVHKVERSGATIRIYTSVDRFFEGKIGDYPGSPVKKIAAATQDFQDWLDARQPIVDLPDDDPDKYTDPARPDLFWEERDGITYLVGRSVLATVTYSGQGANIEYSIELRRVG